LEAGSSGLTAIIDSIKIIKFLKKEKLLVWKGKNAYFCFCQNNFTMKTKETELEDPAVLYGVPGQITDSEVLTYLHTKDVNWKYVNAIKSLTNFNDEVISDWLNISVRTFRTYRQPENKFKENTKEQIILLLSLIRHGIEVFGSSKDFDNWLQGENFYFDGKTPNTFLNTVTGIRFVDDHLTAIEHGDNA
jgi:uncharacterized protein (DUF2384 family)